MSLIRKFDEFINKNKSKSYNINESMIRFSNEIFVHKNCSQNIMNELIEFNRLIMHNNKAQWHDTRVIPNLWYFQYFMNTFSYLYTKPSFTHDELKFINNGCVMLSEFCDHTLSSYWSLFLIIPRDWLYRYYFNQNSNLFDLDITDELNLALNSVSLLQPNIKVQNYEKWSGDFHNDFDYPIGWVNSHDFIYDGAMHFIDEEALNLFERSGLHVKGYPSYSLWDPIIHEQLYSASRAYSIITATHILLVCSLDHNFWG